MLDLVKTFLLGIWVDKKLRYFVLFVIVCGVYKWAKWLTVWFTYQLLPVDFVRIQDDGALVFSFVERYEQVIYPENYSLPTRYGKRVKKFDLRGFRDSKVCEREFFKIYEQAVNALIRSSANKKFVLDFKAKFPKKIGEASYLDNYKNSVDIYESLYRQGMIFDKGTEINFCKILQDKQRID